MLSLVRFIAVDKIAFSTPVEVTIAPKTSYQPSASWHDRFTGTYQVAVYPDMNPDWGSIEAEVSTLEEDTAADQLVALIETYLASRNEDSMQEFRTALLEIKAQCPYDEQFRTELDDFDRVLHDRFRSILEAGQGTGDFRDDFNPDRTADFIVTVLNGCRLDTLPSDPQADQ